MSLYLCPYIYHLLGASVTLVPRGATWRYLDNGANQGTAWRAPAFDDSSWASGPAELGYGDGGEATVVGYGPDTNNKYITTYFRHGFNVTDAASLTNLTLRIVRDDGVVVYLNGTEVYRNNMPSGTISYTTLASAAIGGADESTFYESAVNAALLVEGANVLAVEIHQSAGNSSDISFNLELIARRELMQITLNAPLHGATGVSLSPTLDVSVTHRNGLPMSVTFYGRPAPAVGPDFTLIALPDTQFYASSLNGGTPQIFTAQTEWILANLSTRNIVFTTQLGDCVQNGDNGGNDIEWRNATNAMYRLEDPLRTLLTYGLPYGIAVGNHDQSPIGSATGTTTFFNQYFGEAHFTGRPYYGGHYGTNNDEHFELFSASGLNFIIIHLEYDTAMTTNSAELDWANQLLQTYSDRQAIIVSHWIMNSGENGTFSAQGQAIYNRLKVNPNLFMLLCGHVSEEGKRTDVYNGRTVYTMLSDYQGRVNGGDGWLRILEFSPANSAIRVRTYSPTLNLYETDANSQFDLYYDMQSLLGNPYSTIAVNSGVASGSRTTAVWSGLALSTEYEWFVSVGDGVETAASSIWRFRTADETLPAAPSALTALARSSTEILVTWADNSTNEAGFAVYQSLDGVNFSSVGTVAADATGATITGLQPNTTYHYRVHAFNGAGYSSDSNTASATTPPPPPPPAAPTGLTASPVSQTQVTLAWTDNANNEEGFRIERSTDGTSFTEVGAVGANVTVFSDTGLAALTLYYYRVRAYNIGGFSAYSEIASVTTQPPPPPPAPTGLTAVAGDRSVTLTWNETPGANRYFAYRSTVSGGPYGLAAYGIVSTTWTDTGVTPGTPYFYVVTAGNQNPQESLYSNEASATPYAVPAAPSGAMISFAGADNLELTWTDHAMDEIGYRIERSLDNVSFALIANLEPNTAVFGDNGLTDNTIYYYRIKAFNEFTSSAPAEVSGTTEALPANAPSNLTATTLSSSQIRLAWTDNANNEDGFRIERSTSGGSFMQLVVLAKNTTSHTDSGLTAGTSYTYRVLAFNPAGDSAFAEASATTSVPTTVTFISVSAQDGYALESSENSNIGGSANSSASNTSGLRAGDDGSRRQFKTVVSFNTTSIPDGATVISATLRLKRGTVAGTNPFQTHGNCYVDIKGGAGFNNSTTLTTQDFQAPADAAQVATLSNAAANGEWSEGALNPQGLSFVNKTGTTQCRVYFQLDDNNNSVADYIGWYPANNSTAANRPQLVIVYQQ